MIVVYKFGKRFDGNLSPKEGVNLYWLHSQAHNGKVLFTTSKSPSPENRDLIDEIILTTADGSIAVHAKVDSLSKYAIMNPPKEYLVPSPWENEDTGKKVWFALSDVRKIDGGIKPGDFTCVSGKDLLQSISGNAYMVYC